MPETTDAVDAQDWSSPEGRVTRDGGPHTLHRGFAMPKFDMPGEGTASAELRVVSDLTAVTSGEHDLMTKHLLLEAPVEQHD
jgi:hypothetical protein